MAIKKNGSNDSFSGKLGGVVNYKWKGRECGREWVKPKDRKTPAQLECRRIFGRASSIGSAMVQVVRIGFRGIAEEQQTTEKNVFVKLNRRHISVVDDEVVVDYPHLQVADGHLEPVDFGEPVTADGRTISVAFSGSPQANRFNYVMLAIYLPQKHYCLLSEPVFRRAGSAEIILPESWVGYETHLYGFCWDGKNEVSPSSYIGVVNGQNS